MTVDDDRQRPEVDDGAGLPQDLEKVQSRSADGEGQLGGGRQDEEHEEARDAHEPIAAREAKNRRTRKEGDMPPVREVLRRTTSLSQASVQGG